MPRKDPAQRRAYQSEYSLRRYHEDPKHRRKHAARRTLNHAIKQGLVVPQVCEFCGDPKAQAHHDDYDKPLEVMWLCRKHHEERHGGAGCREDLD